MILNYIVKFGDKERFDEEQIGVKETFTVTNFPIYFIQGLLNLDGQNCQKYLYLNKAHFLTLIMLHKLTQSF